MNLTKEKVARMIDAAEKNGFSKEDVFKKIRLNKKLHARTEKIAKDYWER